VLASCRAYEGPESVAVRAMIPRSATDNAAAIP
jgi:hypothetical protein